MKVTAVLERCCITASKISHYLATIWWVRTIIGTTREFAARIIDWEIIFSGLTGHIFTWRWYPSWYCISNCGFTVNFIYVSCEDDVYSSSFNTRNLEPEIWSRNCSCSLDIFLDGAGCCYSFSAVPICLDYALFFIVLSLALLVEITAICTI
jgi:hypothetical protein